MLGLETRTGSTQLLDPGHRATSHGVAWAERVLREQEMPADELRVVLTSADRDLVRRHLDLHMERLDEWLDSQKRRVEVVGRILTRSRDPGARTASTRPSATRRELRAADAAAGADCGVKRPASTACRAAGGRRIRKEGIEWHVTPTQR
jgi:hypothetical protein